MVGTAFFNARQTRLEMQPDVLEKLAALAVWPDGDGSIAQYFSDSSQKAAE